MASLRVLSTTALALALTAAGDQSVGATTFAPRLTFTKLWTHGHTTPGQVSEIPAFDRRTNTIWVAGVVGVDVLDAATGTLVAHIDVTTRGAVNSVAIHDGLAAFAVEAASQSAACPSCDRRNPGKVLLYDTSTRSPIDGVNEVEVGSLPDMLTFTHDGRTLLVANEGTPNVAADTSYASVDPAGSVSVIDVETRAVIATPVVGDAPNISGSNLRLPISTGMDFEPESIAVNHSDTRAFVTVQEANAIAVLNLRTYEFTHLIGLGAKDFSLPGNEIDPKDIGGIVVFRSVDAKGFYMPDGVATYRRKGKTYLVMANEGDFREDNADRSQADALGAVPPLHRLRVSNRDSAAGNFFAAGARSFSIRTPTGDIVYDSGSILDNEAHARGIYDDGRSRDKGVEPEGVAIVKIGSRTYAFIGLERTTQAAVAVFDITDPEDTTFVDMMVTPGDLSPEGLAAFKYRGNHFLAISNEVPAMGATTSNTTLYLIGRGGGDDDDDAEE